MSLKVLVLVGLLFQHFQLFGCVRVFTATPGPPYALAVLSVSKRHVDLQWEAPKNDGGRPILRYYHLIWTVELEENIMT